MEPNEAEALAELASLDDDLNSEDLDRLEDEAEQEMMEELEREEDAAGDVEPAPEPGSDGDESEPEFLVRSPARKLARCYKI